MSSHASMSWEISCKSKATGPQSCCWTLGTYSGQPRKGGKQRKRSGSKYILLDAVPAYSKRQNRDTKDQREIILVHQVSKDHNQPDVRNEHYPVCEKVSLKSRGGCNECRHDGHATQSCESHGFGNTAKTLPGLLDSTGRRSGRLRSDAHRRDGITWLAAE